MVLKKYLHTSRFDYGLKIVRMKVFYSEVCYCFLRNEGYAMQGIGNKRMRSYKRVHHILHRTVHAASASNHDTKTSGRPRCTTLQVDKNIRISSLRNRCLI